MFLNISWIILLNLSSAPLSLWDSNLDFVSSQLEQISITRNYCHIITSSFSTTRHSTQQIVSLKSRFGNNWNIHSTKHFLGIWHLLMKFVRHAFSGALVSSIHLVAEGWRLLVKCNCQMIRLLHINEAKHHIQESIHSIGVLPLGICKGRHAIEGSIQYTMSINQQKFLAHITPRILINLLSLPW